MVNIGDYAQNANIVETVAVDLLITDELEFLLVILVKTLPLRLDV